MLRDLRREGVGGRAVSEKVEKGGRVVNPTEKQKVENGGQVGGRVVVSVIRWVGKKPLDFLDEMD